ncbi:hypothetical protein BU17DRAFT_64320 [Hysterangium stoloniferum]|nr:hypothetical protein BU17DRAFT_64320 [Hysterangium stoloniferum]
MGPVLQRSLDFRFWDRTEKRVEINGLPEVLHYDGTRMKVAGEKTISVPNPLEWMPLPSCLDDVEDRPLKLKDCITRNGSERIHMRKVRKLTQSPILSNFKLLGRRVTRGARGFRSKVSLYGQWDELSCTSTQSLRAKNV